MSSELRGGGETPLGIYLHAPFCVSHCTYCDFYTRSFTGHSRVREFAAALAQGVRLSARDLGVDARRVDTVYFGGGTPSLLDPEDVELLLAAVRQTFRVDPGAEISLEANPESVDLAKLRALRDLGVNRLSLGVQSFDPAVLQELGRAHTPDRAVMAFEAAREAGFDNISLDLMLALPGQNRALVRKDLKKALSLAPDHLSAYLLEMDKETALRARIERGELQAIDEDEAGDCYEILRSGMTRAGYRHYEISNYARRGRECRHNLKYWTDRPFVGFGPSAWSYLGGGRFKEAADLEGYLDSVGRGEAPRRETLGAEPADRMDEAIFAGLRLVEGVDLERVGRSYGVADPLGERRQAVTDLEAAGFVRLDGSRLRLTPRSYCIANEIFGVFV